MGLYICLELKKDTKIDARLNEGKVQSYLCVDVGHANLVRIEGNLEKLCEMHDKIGQIIAHMIEQGEKPF